MHQLYVIIESMHPGSASGIGTSLPRSWTRLGTQKSIDSAALLGALESCSLVVSGNLWQPSAKNRASRVEGVLVSWRVEELRTCKVADPDYHARVPIAASPDPL